MNGRGAGLLIVMLSLPALAGDPKPCELNKPGDRALRALVKTAFTTNQSLVKLQNMFHFQETPVAGKAGAVDELAWCRCVYRKRVETLGESLALTTYAPDPKAPGTFVAKGDISPPLETPGHSRDAGWYSAAQLGDSLRLRSIDASCINESQK